MTSRNLVLTKFRAGKQIGLEMACLEVEGLNLSSGKHVLRLNSCWNKNNPALTHFCIAISRGGEGDF
jgi:hypothetical protein